MLQVMPENVDKLGTGATGSSWIDEDCTVVLRIGDWDPRGDFDDSNLCKFALGRTVEPVQGDAKPCTKYSKGTALVVF